MDDRGAGMMERMKAYHDRYSRDDLMKARGEGIILDDGEAFKYEFTHKDSLGVYDLWFRPANPISTDLHDPADDVTNPDCLPLEQVTDRARGAILAHWMKGEAVHFLATEGWITCNPHWRSNAAYRIPPAPKRETVTLYGSDTFYNEVSCGDIRSITLDTLDGQPIPGTYTSPDGNQIVVEALS